MAYRKAGRHKWASTNFDIHEPKEKEISLVIGYEFSIQFNIYYAVKIT